MDHATLDSPDLTVFCGLDELGLEAVGQRVEAGRALIACRIVDDDDWCHRCGCQGRPRDTSTRRPALQAMLRYLENASADGETIDYVIVHKLDRLARNRADDVALNQRFDDLGIRLISTSENIDQTPGGMLLHGIMSSIAEFYSLNLSNEVKKGMGEKARNGGCIGRAPLGYRNTTVDTEGGQAHIAALDTERADLVSWAFTAYAIGDYTLKSLAAELNSRGLTVPATARLPERPISIQSLHRLLSNPFYTGQVTYRGALYPGTHQALTDTQTFQRVQSVLSSKANGERTIPTRTT